MNRPLQQTHRPFRLPGRRSLFCLLALNLILLLISLSVVAISEAAPQPMNTTPQRPVILLTGFEPFGAERPPNPSWEAIKHKNGKQWKGYQLVCKQMRVVWGEPLQQLPGWITQYKPVAVFSFGMGGEGRFSLESKASNERRDIRDNLDEYPSFPLIVNEGPEKFSSSMPCDKYARVLTEKGFPVRVSTRAGRYLCEETLYSLEYLKASRHLEATVMFCHVPPLQSEIDDEEVTAGYVTQFVEALLETWFSLQPSEMP
jgi:pyroglutamyl-peptidase